MGMYRKTAPVEAHQWLPDEPEKAGYVIGWVVANGGHCHLETRPHVNKGLWIHTLEDGPDGQPHYASPGDWICRGPAGEFWPIKADIFAATYEPVYTEAEVRHMTATGYWPHEKAGE